MPDSLKQSLRLQRHASSSALACSCHRLYSLNLALVAHAKQTENEWIVACCCFYYSNFAVLLLSAKLRCRLHLYIAVRSTVAWQTHANTSDHQSEDCSLAWNLLSLLLLLQARVLLPFATKSMC